jgi:sugar lactone lactonase YvrE
MSPTIETASTVVCLLGEGPVWDEVESVIRWVDIHNGHVHRWHPDSRAYHRLDIGETIGAIALCGNGGLIAALQSGIAFVDASTGAMQRLHTPEAHLPGNRFNDGKCDPSGRFWAGTMPFSADKPTGSLYLTSGDGSIRRMLEDVTISNGLAWNRRKNRMYYIDTPMCEVSVFEYDDDSGSIRDRRTAVAIPREEGFPDGMTIDVEDMLWVAHWGGARLTRWDPEKGRKIGEIRLPVSNVTSCTFGGRDFRDLYITTAREGLSEVELASQPQAGMLFVVKDSPWQGLPASRFKG